MQESRKRERGVLFLYNRPTLPWATVDAANVDENVAAFERHMSLPMWGLNTDLGYRPALDELDFEAVVLHYTVFVWGGPYPRGYLLDQEFLDFLSRSHAYKVAFFQDEYHWCRKRFDFLNDFGFDCVYTMLEQPYADQVYRERTSASKVVPHLPSYVSEELHRGAARFAKPESKRRNDIAYRGPSPLPAYMGRGGVEKVEVGRRFLEVARDSGLTLDIELSEQARLYADDWHRFTADSRATLGSESGVSCFDLEDEVRLEYERLSEDGHEPTLEEMERGALGRWDWNIPYRTISPRNFEAAIFRVTQILFEGSYSGLMEPMRHYIPLKKDFSNLDEVIARFRDADLRRELTENAHRDLIASGEHTYERFIGEVDAGLRDAGIRPERSSAETRQISRALRRGLRERLQRWHRTRLNWLYVNHRRWARVVLFIEAPFRLAGRLLSAWR